jgi:hypothetical protein
MINLTQKPLEEEKDYISGKHKYITSGTNITKLINLIGKTLPEIRREILYAEQNGTLVDEMAESMYKECPSMSLGYTEIFQQLGDS